MPRLSIIVPHRQDDQQLEATILSVLENRPRDCEVIVVHDGSYLDPYQLSDELIYVQEEQGASLTELLNAGLMAACSPIVCTLLDGVLATTNWSETAIKHFARPEVSCVAPQLQAGRNAIFGLDGKSFRNIAKLRSGRVNAIQARDCGAPTLACGFYRRKLLLALGGWCDVVGSDVADIELALILSEHNQVCVSEPACIVTANAASVRRKLSKEACYELAGVGTAHDLINAGLATAISSLLSGILTGNFSLAIAWASGLLSNSAAEHISVRRKHACQHLQTRDDAACLRIFTHAEPATAAEPTQRRVRRDAA